MAECEFDCPNFKKDYCPSKACQITIQKDALDFCRQTLEAKNTVGLNSLFVDAIAPNEEGIYVLSGRRTRKLWVIDLNDLD